jgi:hypothetical protein
MEVNSQTSHGDIGVRRPKMTEKTVYRQFRQSSPTQERCDQERREDHDGPIMILRLDSQ